MYRAFLQCHFLDTSAEAADVFCVKPDQMYRACLQCHFVETDDMNDGISLSVVALHFRPWTTKSLLLEK